MASPNFSEAQLQSAVNTALTIHLNKRYGYLPFAIIPSLRTEFLFGWDSGFYLPKISKGQLNQEGCNFFIQYKLSDQLTKSNASQWSYWNEPYFRFKIPHNKDDFHQWDTLKKLANDGYAVFYATNNTLSREQLIEHYQSEKLLNNTPCLDVDQVNGRHHYVTFTNTSNNFFLHSELEESKQTSLSETLEELNNQQESLREANQRLFENLKSTFRENNKASKNLSFISNLLEDNIPGYITHFYLSSFVFSYLGSILLWVSKNRLD